MSCCRIMYHPAIKNDSWARLWRGTGHAHQLRLIADNLSKAGWSWSCMSAVDRQGQTIFIADAHRDDGERLVVHADEKLTAFLELESAVPHCAKK